MIAPLEYVRPHRLDEALDFLSDHGKETTIIAGGTDVLIGLRSGALKNRYLMDVSRLPELKGIELNKEGLCVGAGVTLSEIYISKTLTRFAPALQKAAFHFGSKQIRNMATIGGNAGNASPCADTVPPLITHDTRAVLGNKNGERTVPIEELAIGPYRSAVLSDEVITRFILKPSEGVFADFQKIVRRKAVATSRISMAVMAERDARGKLTFIRLALGSMTPTPRRMREVEDFLIGKRPDEALLREAGRILAAKTVEISGHRASTVYKEKAVQGLFMRMFYGIM